MVMMMIYHYHYQSIYLLNSNLSKPILKFFFFFALLSASRRHGSAVSFDKAVLENERRKSLAATTIYAAPQNAMAPTPGTPILQPINENTPLMHSQS